MCHLLGTERIWRLESEAIDL
ncbi:hypothetical protein AGR6A_pb0033 [Agrobacterium sp. NCPPB 925]|nr:hypothetical protein AGR6A_pb0033 [Agrobacterium sp. NCPPB 925]